MAEQLDFEPLFIFPVPLGKELAWLFLNIAEHHQGMCFIVERRKEGINPVGRVKGVTLYVRMPFERCGGLVQSS